MINQSKYSKTLKGVHYGGKLSYFEYRSAFNVAAKDRFSLDFVLHKKIVKGGYNTQPPLYNAWEAIILTHRRWCNRASPTHKGNMGINKIQVSCMQ